MALTFTTGNTFSNGDSATSTKLNNIVNAATYAGQLEVAAGGTGLSTFGGANTLLYTTAANVLASLATANNGVLITSGAGVPSISSTIPAATQLNITQLGTVTAGTWNGTTLAIANGGTGQTSAAAAFNALSPMTTLGDLIYGGTSGAGTRLAGNTTSARNFLRQTGTGAVSAAPVWDTLTKTDVGLSNVENTALSTWAGSTNVTTLGTVSTGTWNGTALAVAYGGTGSATAAGARSNLGAAASGSNSDITSLTGLSTALSVAQGGTAVTSFGGSNTLLYTSSANTLSSITTANNGVLITSGAGVPSISSTIPAATQLNITQLGTITSGTWNGTTLAVANGGTGGTTAATARSGLSIFGSNLEYTTTGAIQAGTLGNPLVYTSGPYVSLTAGTWLLWGSCMVRFNDSAGAEIWLGFNNNTDSIDFGKGAGVKPPDTGTLFHISCFGFTTIASGTKTIYLKAFLSGSHTLELGSVNGISGAIRAVLLYI